MSKTPFHVMERRFWDNGIPHKVTWRGKNNFCFNDSVTDDRFDSAGIVVAVSKAFDSAKIVVGIVRDVLQNADGTVTVEGAIEIAEDFRGEYRRPPTPSHEEMKDRIAEGLASVGCKMSDATLYDDPQPGYSSIYVVFKCVATPANS